MKRRDLIKEAAVVSSLGAITTDSVTGQEQLPSSITFAEVGIEYDVEPKSSYHGYLASSEIDEPIAHEIIQEDQAIQFNSALLTSGVLDKIANSNNIFHINSYMNSPVVTFSNSKTRSLVTDLGSNLRDRKSLTLSKPAPLPRMQFEMKSGNMVSDLNGNRVRIPQSQERTIELESIDVDLLVEELTDEKIPTQNMPEHMWPTRVREKEVQATATPRIIIRNYGELLPKIR